MRQALGQIAPGFPAPEQELEQTAQMGRERLLAARMRSRFELADESDDIVRCDRVQIAELGAEAKRQEPLHESRAVIDGGLGQPALLTQVVFVLDAQALRRS